MTAIARRSALAALVASVIAVPATVHAAGLEAPDNGAYILARGGTGVALLGTAYSLQFNPAGLSEVQDMDVRVDTRFIKSDVTFQRSPYINGGGAGIDNNFNPVSNTAGMFVAPSLYFAYRLRDYPNLVLGGGVYGPPGIGRYQYPDPRSSYGDADFVFNDVQSNSGQRYNLIANANKILLPTIGAAYRVADSFSLGLSASLAVAHITFSQATAGAPNGGQETLAADVLVDLDVRTVAFPVLLAGAMWKPLKGLAIGAAFRPGYTLNLKGTMKVCGNPSLLLTQQSTNGDPVTYPNGSPANPCDPATPATPNRTDATAVTITINQPTEARLGASYNFGPVTLNAEGVFEGWSANDKLTLSAPTIQVVKGDGSKSIVGTSVVTKGWQNIFGGRFGASVRLKDGNRDQLALQLHLGTLYEQNAIPAERQAVDTVTGNRLGFSGGLTATYQGWGVTLGAMEYMPVNFTVSNSLVQRGVSGCNVTDPTTKDKCDNPPVIVGNGTYDAKLFIAAISLSYTSAGH